MSLEKIHLRKLLQIFYASDSKRKSLLRHDIRTTLKIETGEDANGGDFYGPFWADAKKHVAGQIDLRESAKHRIDSHKNRERLYPLLVNGFLGWWENKRRWQNEPFEFIDIRMNSQFQVRELGAVVKVENLLSLRIRDQFNRIIYPYFSEEPRLPEEGGRIALWLLGEALADYRLEDVRVLDILRGRSFAAVDVPLQGNERDLFVRKYESTLNEWRKLRREY